jgi:hypothetical protein
VFLSARYFLSTLLALPPQPPQLACASPYKIGTRVEVFWQEEDQWYQVPRST